MDGFFQRQQDVEGYLEKGEGRCEMSKLIVKKGNTFIKDFPIFDRNGALVSMLSASGVGVEFEIKKNKTDAVALVQKTLLNGIQADVPALGWIRLSLKPTDTDQTPDLYWMACEITQGTDVWEVFLRVDKISTERLEIVQDIIL